MGNLCSIFLCNIFSNEIEDDTEYEKNIKTPLYITNEIEIKKNIIDIQNSLPMPIPKVNQKNIDDEQNYSLSKLYEENKPISIHHYNNNYNNNDDDDDDILSKNLLYYKLPNNFDLHCD